MHTRTRTHRLPWQSIANNIINYISTTKGLATISEIFTTDHDDHEVIEVVSVMVAKAPLVVGKNFKP